MDQRTRCLDMDDFVQDWKDFAKVPIVKFYWGYDDSIKVDIYFRIGLCIIVIEKEEMCTNFHDVEGVKKFIQECLDKYSNSLVYRGFQNFYPLLKENNCEDIKAELQSDVAILSCKLSGLSMIFEIRGSKKSYALIEITQKQWGNPYKFYTSPLNVSSMQSEFFGALPNNSKCRAFWKTLAREFPYLITREKRGLHWKRLSVCGDEWVEVTLDKTGTTFSLKVCSRGYYQDINSHTIQYGEWSDFHRLGDILEVLKNNDVCDTCDMDEYRQGEEQQYEEYLQEIYPQC